MAGLGSWVGGSVGKGRRENSALAGSDGFNIIFSGGCRSTSRTKKEARSRGMGRFGVALKKRRDRQAPGGAASFDLSSATAQPAWGPRRGFEPRWSPDLRFLVLRSTARSGISIIAVGHADLCHVVIGLAPCIIAAAAGDVSCLSSTFAFCGIRSGPYA
jgi:hypothetical protein